MTAHRRAERPPANTRHVRRVVLGAGAGAIVETYDFFAFATAATLYLGPAFFPNAGAEGSSLAALAVLAVGFAARPLGGVIGGHFGDTRGRKPVFVASLLVMGAATFAIGTLPTYQSVGVAAPIMLVVLRVIQGLAFGAEWGCANLLSYEHAPARRRGLFTAIVQAGFPLGLLLATVTFLFSARLAGDMVWRVPFLASAAVVGIGLLVRLRVPESPDFEDLRRKNAVHTRPLVEALRRDRRNILRGIGLRLAESAGCAVAVGYAPAYLRSAGLADPIQALIALCIAAFCGIFCTVWWGSHVDRVGRRPVFLWVCVFGILYGVIHFALLSTGELALIICAFSIAFCVCQAALAGSEGVWLPELFPIHTRVSASALAYQLSAVVAGFSPLLAALVYREIGWVGPGLLFSAFAAIGLTSAVLTPEHRDAAAS